MLASATTYLMAQSTDNSSIKLILPSFQRRIFSSNLLHKATLKEQHGVAISYRQRRKGNKSLMTLRPHWGRKSVIWVQEAKLVSGSWKSPKLFSKHRGSGPQIKTLSRFNPQQQHHTDPSAGSSRASGTTGSPSAGQSMETDEFGLAHGYWTAALLTHPSGLRRKTLSSLRLPIES